LLIDRQFLLAGAFWVAELAVFLNPFQVAQ
jgi:hypothetical protein